MSVEPGTRTQRGGSTREPAFEPTDAAAGKLGLTAAALVGTVLLLCALVAGLFLLFDRESPPPGAAPAGRPPEPRLQVKEPDQRRRLEAAAAANLAPGAGRIGIDEAMRRTAAAGWGDAR